MARPSDLFDQAARLCCSVPTCAAAISSSPAILSGLIKQGTIWTSSWSITGYKILTLLEDVSGRRCNHIKVTNGKE
ncbi:hypothetical protein ACP70R_033831 [Stipagrostis hirtigluma subsp. patula]